MDSSLFLLSLTLCVALLFFRRNVGLNLSATSVLFQLMFLFHSLAYVYYTRVWGPDTAYFHEILAVAPKTNVVAELDVALALVYLGICLGVAGMNTAMGCSRRTFAASLDRWSAANVAASRVVSQRVMLAATVGILLLGAFAVLDSQVGKVVEYFTSDAAEFAKIELRHEGGSRYYTYNLLLAGILPFLSFCLVASRRTAIPAPLVLALPFIALLTLGKAATLSKAPLAIFLLQLVVTWVLCGSIKMSGRKVLLFMVISPALFAFMTIIALPNLEGAMAVLDFLFYRVFMVANEGLMEYFAAIPSVIPHSWGAQLSWMSSLLESQPRSPTFLLVAEVHRGFIGSTTTVMFMGDAWADFAWAGVVLFSILCGAVVRAIDIALIVRRGKTVETIAGLGLAHFGLFTAMSTSLQTAFLTGGLLLVIPLVWILEKRLALFGGAAPVAGK